MIVRDVGTQDQVVFYSFSEREADGRGLTAVGAGVGAGRVGRIGLVLIAQVSPQNDLSLFYLRLRYRTDKNGNEQNIELLHTIKFCFGKDVKKRRDIQYR